ncbi:MAG: hypothetical protein FWF50_05330 [Defluviitaleaceae bacterium]|nr:hypothetical protein [Defluviitaleaceae bacterium]
MPSGKEISVEQKRRLYPLLLAKNLPEKEREKTLDTFIDALITEMDAEDISHVEKQVQKRIDSLKD